MNPFSCNRRLKVRSRREFLATSSFGFGSMALSYLLGRDLASAATDPQRLHDYLYAMVQHFAVMGVSSLLTLETDPPIMASDENHGRLSHMSDNIVFLDVRPHEGIVVRSLRIAKARGIAHDLQAREIEIDARGVRIVEGRL